MRQDERLATRLAAYSAGDMYPFHMPGHKRFKGKADGDLRGTDFPDPFSIDITEIDGFDNLHHPEGLLRDSMEWAAGIYGADRTYYLVNGSSGGILAAVSAAAGHGSRILMARNCHKSVYHAVYLNRLEAAYLYPQPVPELGIQGGILPEDVEKALKIYPDIRAVMVVSPTYDGIVSDIHKIAEIVHRAGVPLIVDEAHGAHFRYAEEFPVTALELGADLVIQSVHKTLPSLTQTALLHVKLNGTSGGPRVDIGRLERFLQIYQSSSPSYVFMASIENAVAVMEEQRAGRGLPGNAVDRYMKGIEGLRARLGGMKRLRLAGEELKGRFGVHDVDISKIVVSTAGTGMTGAKLDQLLRQRYHLEMEMCGADYVTAITSVCDSMEGLERLEAALLEIDGELGDGPAFPSGSRNSYMPRPCGLMSIADAMDKAAVRVALKESRGCISGEYIYIYPPGIPIVAPGEEITREVLELVTDYMEQGLPVQGPEDKAMEWLNVVKRE